MKIKRAKKLKRKHKAQRKVPDLRYYTTIMQCTTMPKIIFQPSTCEFFT